MIESVAVIGLGNIANRHRKNLRVLFPNVKILAMSASGREPAEKISDCDEVVLNLEQIIQSNVNFAIVASPATFHAKHAITLIKANIPVLIEKPITASNEDTVLLTDIVSKIKVPVAVAYCLRYLPSMKIVEQLLQERKIGQLYNSYIEIGQYLPDWRPTKDFRESVSANKKLGGGALLELSHELDYTQALLGPLSLEFAILRSSEELGLDVEDSADIILSTSENSIVNIHLDFLQRQAYRRCRFVGSQGCIEWDLIKNTVVLIEPQSEKIIYSEPLWDKNQMYLNMLNDFVCKINNEENQCITVDEAVETVNLVNNIKQFKNIWK